MSQMYSTFPFCDLCHIGLPHPRQIGPRMCGFEQRAVDDSSDVRFCFAKMHDAYER
jgi:hypothetical protein